MSEDTCKIALQIGTKISLVKMFFWRKKKQKKKTGQRGIGKKKEI